MSITNKDIVKGAENLLLNCGKVTDETKVLIITEPSEEFYYDDRVVHAVTEVADRLCQKVEVLKLPFNPVVTDPSPELSAKMAEFDRVIFLARLGDQLRFRPSVKGTFSIMSYALDGEMLESPFGQADYRAFEKLKILINEALANAQEIHVTCAQGTDFKGPGANFPAEVGETTIKRYPLSVFSPIPPEGFSGKVAQVGFLVGTGSQVYEPPACEIKDKVFVHFDQHKITKFDGSEEDVTAVEKHYDHVANLFNLERNHIHSWHAGIHPGCNYTKEANFYFGRWSNGAFGNPRLLHFHTCGTHAPGEISLNVIDPTIKLDGVAVWEDGILHPERIKGGQELLDSDPYIAELFANPATNVGLGSSGKLEF